ncbi:MAG: Nif3-like dinuclear metal center hexameric protein, partial [Clostridia bacterium]|nr:Nif3-like dinuclear metal center hexameric protein [Clostridia bacterium]
MTVKQLYDILDSRIPRSLSCEWDNDGLMCCPNGEKEVKKVLIALDVTAQVVEYAISGGYDAIVSHHPFIFKGIKSINEESYISEKAIRLIQNGISVFSFHTRLDAVSGGVNDRLCELLELTSVQSFGEGDIGRIGELDTPLDGEALAAKIKSLLHADGVFLADAGKPCKRIAVLGGSGGDCITDAISAGADAYISGTLSYHAMTDAPDMGITLIEAGHFYTEYPVCANLCKMIKEADSNMIC